MVCVEHISHSKSGQETKEWKEPAVMENHACIVTGNMETARWERAQKGHIGASFRHFQYLPSPSFSSCMCVYNGQMDRQTKVSRVFQLILKTVNNHTMVTRVGDWFNMATHMAEQNNGRTICRDLLYLISSTLGYQSSSSEFHTPKMQNKLTEQVPVPATKASLPQRSAWPTGWSQSALHSSRRPGCF